MSLKTIKQKSISESTFDIIFFEGWAEGLKGAFLLASQPGQEAKRETEMTEEVKAHSWEIHLMYVTNIV